MVELTGDTSLNETELEKMRLAEEAAELQRLTKIAAPEVGYLYFVGDADLHKRWMDDVKQSNLSLIYREYGKDLEVGQLDENMFLEDEEEDEEEDEQEDGEEDEQEDGEEDEDEDEEL